MRAARPRALVRRRPPALASGARVALLAPAGPLRGPGDVAIGEANARSLGWEPVVGAHVLDREGYFAGRDADRLADLNRALADDAIDAVWCLRGGYGIMRLLERIDYDAVRRRPKTLIGYSDITALHAALAREAGVVTLHGPVARNPLGPLSRESLVRAAAQSGDPCGRAPGARTIRPGRAGGRLAGGNLALLAALAGTRWAPRFDGAVLLLEDINEAVYRVDRMLVQLRLAGMLDGVRAIAFGQCTDCAEEAGDGRRALDDVLAETADALRVPCLAGIPLGHVDEQWTFPLGMDAEVDADAGTVHVTT